MSQVYSDKSMKLILENITVRCLPPAATTGAKSGIDVPEMLLWHGQWYEVQAVQAIWKWRGGWWATPTLQGQVRIYYRVLCTPSYRTGLHRPELKSTEWGGAELCLELYSESGHWTLSRILD